MAEKLDEEVALSPHRVVIVLSSVRMASRFMYAKRNVERL